MWSNNALLHTAFLVQKPMVCQFTTVVVAGLVQSARYGSMTNTKAAVTQPPTLSKAHPLANRKILKELAIF
jgi:hypothetical protein